MSEVIAPRLLDTEASAAYLGVSEWTLRAWVRKGHIRPVKPPSTLYKSRANRRVLFDRADLDQAVNKWKEAS